MKNTIKWLTTIILLCVVLIVSLFVLNCVKNSDDGTVDNGAVGNENVGNGDTDGDQNSNPQYQLFAKPSNANTKIGVAYSVVGEAVRRKPELSDEGLSRYPVYGQNFRKSGDETDGDFTLLKTAVLAENAYLNACPSAVLAGECTNYDAFDSDGYVYLNGEPVIGSDGNRRRLYKHTASQNMYFGNVSDNEKAVIKRIKIQPRASGNYITGLYAPAGEVIKLTISEADLNNVGSFYVYVGATLSNGDANNIWLERDFNRMPVISNKMPVNADACAYDATTKTYTCYFGSYFGGPVYVGTPSNKTTFRVEISGAVEYPHFIYGLTTEKEYNELLKSSAPYFDLEVFDNSVRFSGPRLYSDKYSYAELCAAAELWDKIARVSNQVPTGSNAATGIDFLFEPFVAAGAAVAFVGRNTVNCPTDWMDECLNVENFLINGSWGNIHEFNHHFQNYGLENRGEVTNNAVSLVEYSLFTKISSKRSLSDGALSGWNAYTDASRALRTLLDNVDKGGVVESLDAYATVLHSFGQSVFIEATKNGLGADNWFKNLCRLTRYDFTYYFTELLRATVSQSVIDEVKQCGYPVYVPAACIYQTGTKYRYGGEVRQITTMQPFEFTSQSYDFNVKALIKLPSGFTVTNVTVDQPRYGKVERVGEDLYRFTPSDKKISGDIDVTVSIIKDDGGFDVEDVTLVFGFKQTQSAIAERTTYYFEADAFAKYVDVDDAVTKNYAGYTSRATYESTFYGSECAAVWWNSEGVRLNAITEYNSKIFITANDTYRFSIRGKKANLYISSDGVNYELAAKAGDKYNNDFKVSVQNGEYKDYALKRGQTVYIKAVVMHADVGWEGCSFVVGMSAAVNGNYSLDDVTKKTTVYNVNYQRERFESDYFYVKEYAVSEFTTETNASSTVVSTNFSPWDSTTVLENMFDGNLSTFMHNEKGKYVTESTPFEIVVDLGRTIKANKITMFGRSSQTQTPVSYRLYGGLSLETTTLLCEYVDEPLKNGCNQIGSFDLTELRYYKLVVTKTNAKYICLSNIAFSVDFDDGKMISPDDKSVNYYGQWTVDYDLSAFGHGYVTNDGYAKIDFTGSQIAIMTKDGKSAKFAVSIDGAEEVVYEFDGTGELLFLSSELENKPHEIVIKAITEIDIIAFAVK